VLASSRKAPLRTHQRIIVAFHLVWMGYGHWLANDIRGSGSSELRDPKFEELGPIHFGRKRKQPSRDELRKFHRRAEPLLNHDVLWFDSAKRQAIVDAFDEVVRRFGYTVNASAVLRNHAHQVIRRHRDDDRTIWDTFAYASREAIRKFSDVNREHPIWSDPSVLRVSLQRGRDRGPDRLRQRQLREAQSPEGDLSLREAVRRMAAHPAPEATVTVAAACLFAESTVMIARLLVLALLTSSNLARAAAPITPPTTLPSGLGVNIHFTHPRPGEMEMLAAGGFTLVRMDFSWARTERKQGIYDFKDYDNLLAALDAHRVRAILILDYNNPLYDDNLSPHTAAGRAAFAKWAAAGAAHFKGRGVTWEMWNEPNISQFWHPKANVDGYIQLALEVGRAMRAAAPGEPLIGPACSTMDFPFLEACFKGGLLEYFSAVSVHPYRQRPPETVAEDYARLRQLIARYAPHGKSIPIYSGEWGYSAAWSGYDADKQGAMLPRQWLTNLANDVPVSIWYDWHDDGPDPNEPEHHFGTVRYDYRKGESPVYEPKPAYLAAKELTTHLAGFTYNKRLWLERNPRDARDADHVLLFAKGDDARIAAWTTAPGARVISIPGVLDTLRLTGTVQYHTPAASDALRKLLAWERAPLERFVRAPATVAGRTVQRGDDATSIDVVSPISSAIGQRSRIVVINPLRASLRPRGTKVEIVIDNPSGEPFSGTARFAGRGGGGSGGGQRINLASGQTAAALVLDGADDASVELVDDDGQVVLRTPRQRFVPIPLDADQVDVRPDGDRNVASTQSIAPGERAGELKLTYAFDAGWKFARVVPRERARAAIAGKPSLLGMWVTGDGSGNVLRTRFTDATGQTFQPEGHKVTWTDRRYLTFPIDGTGASHWGGATDGVVHYPVRLDTLVLIDSAAGAGTSGALTISDPCLVYAGDPVGAATTRAR
jgi:hypothetical protein